MERMGHLKEMLEALVDVWEYNLTHCADAELAAWEYLKRVYRPSEEEMEELGTLFYEEQVRWWERRREEGKIEVVGSCPHCGAELTINAPAGPAADGDQLPYECPICGKDFVLVLTAGNFCCI